MKSELAKIVVQHRLTCFYEVSVLFSCNSCKIAGVIVRTLYLLGKLGGGTHLPCLKSKLFFHFAYK